MTQQDDITQRLLTDDEIQALWDEACKDSPQAPGWNRHIRFARALLSKLRAPVADERDRNATISQVVGLCNRIPGATTWNAAQFMYDEMHRRAALASAPVAGQPFMYGIMGPDGKAHFEEFCVSGDRHELQAEVVDHLNRDNPEDGPYAVVALFRDAAPQASAEDVRKPIMTVAEFCTEADRIGLTADTLAAQLAQRPEFADCLPQAGKDGGQQRAGDAERWRWATATDENAQMLYTIVQAYGGDQKKINERADFYRAALSAPQAEQGERDA